MEQRKRDRFDRAAHEATHMAMDGGGREDEVPKFSFGVRELRQADTAKLRAYSAEPPASALQSEPRSESQGFDPYNSTGGFDRCNGWSRLRKR